MRDLENLIIAGLILTIIMVGLTNKVEARNEYLNDGAYACERGHWETYTEVRQHEYKTGTSDEYQDQTLGFRFRMPFGAVCDEEYIAEQKKKQKLKTQLELVKECKRVPIINPPPVEFAELINMCSKLGITSNATFNDDRPDASVSYWTVLKDGWKKENPDRPVFEGK
jgi:hypothetical protein